MEAKKVLKSFAAVTMSVMMAIPSNIVLLAEGDEQPDEQFEQIEETETVEETAEEAVEETEPETAAEPEPEETVEEPAEEAATVQSYGAAETVAETADTVTTVAKEGKVFNAETEQYFVTAKAEAGVLPEDAELRVAVLEENTPEYDEAKEALVDQSDDVDSAEAFDEKYGFAALDVAFFVGEEEVEPNGTVSVSISVKEIPAGKTADQLADTLEVSHLVKNEAGDVTVETVEAETRTVTDNEVKAVFDVDSFSVFAITWGEEDEKTTTNLYFVKVGDGKRDTWNLNGANSDMINVKCRYTADDLSGTTALGQNFFVNNDKPAYIWKRDFTHKDINYVIYDFRAEDFVAVDAGYVYSGLYLKRGENIIPLNDDVWMVDGDPQMYTFPMIGYNGKGISNEQLAGEPITITTEAGVYNIARLPIEPGDEIYCVYSPYLESLTENDTIDSKAKGLHMYMVDWAENDYGWTNYIGGGWKGGPSTQGLFSPKLNDEGFPDAKKTNDATDYTQNMANAYDGEKEVNHLFLQKNYDEDGSFYYSSDQYSAYLNDNGDFSVYSELITPSSEDHFFYQRGNFLPYNKIGTGANTQVLNRDKYTETGESYTGSREDEPLYAGEGCDREAHGVDYFFAMRGEGDFLYMPDGKIGDNPMIFEFTGDDDMVVYIDDVLVLDLGGIHDAMTGYIDFSTGEVYYTTDTRPFSPKSDTTSISAMFEAADKTWDPRPYSIHSLDFFYDERGAGASNLKLKIRLPFVEPDDLELEKKDPDGNPMVGAEFTLTKDGDDDHKVVYTTDENGKILVESKDFFQEGGKHFDWGWTVYQDEDHQIPSHFKLVETKAPEGYELDPAEHGFITLWSDPAEAVHQITMLFDETGSGNITVYNARGKEETAINDEAVDPPTEDTTLNAHRYQEVEVGDVITYKVSFANSTGAPAEAIITDTLDQNLKFLSASYGSTILEDPATSKESDEVKITRDGQTITWEIPAAPTGVDYVEIKAEVLVGALTHDVINTSTAKVGNGSKYEMKPVVNFVPSGALKFKKAVTVNGAEPATANDRALTNGDYTFTVTGPGSDGQFSTTAVITFDNGMARSVKIDDEAGTLYDDYVVLEELIPGEYTITETAPTNGMTPVTSTVKVTVEPNTTRESTKAEATITNNIDTGDLKIEKKVEGTDATDKEFTFEITLTAPEGVTLAAKYPAKKNGAATDDAVVDGITVTVKLKKDETYEILGLPVGTTYKVEEKDLPDGYQQGSHQNETGTITNTAEMTATMNNVYAAEGTVILRATKVFTGREWTDEDQFEFVLTEEAGNPDGAVMPSAADSTRVATQTVQTVAFGAIKFTKPGTFKFAITETDGGVGGIVYDTEKKIVTVTVTDNGDGTLTAVTDKDGNAVTASNTYSSKGELTLKATKVLAGRDWNDEDIFEFTFTADENNPPGWAITGDTVKVAIKDDETVEFPLTFTAEGKFTFYIQETVPEDAEGGVLDGITYDGTKYTFTVTVTDNGEGVMETVCDPEGAAIEVTNTYDAEGSTIPEAKKVLTGNKELVEGMFEFQLLDEDGKEIDKKSNDYEGNVAFDALKYTLADITEEGKVLDSKDFKYTIKEVIPEGVDENYKLDGITYDTTEYELIVTVSDNQDGTLKVEKKYDGKEAAPIFVNTYTAEGDGVLSVTKQLEGREWNDDDEFEFTVEGEDEDTPMPEKTTAVANLENTQTAEFGTIHYTEPGEYTYTITETEGTIPSVTYDTTPYTVVMTVVDNGDGTLTATADYEGEPKLIVTNTYTEYPFEKYSSTGEKVKGAVMQLINLTTGEVVVEWESGEGAFDVGELLERSTEYEIIETDVPKGYIAIEPFDFSVDEHGNVTGLEDFDIDEDGAYKIIDIKIDVKVNKVDSKSKKSISGAELQVLDKDGKVVDSWTSDGSVHQVKDLVAGETYTLHEVKAPAKYELAKDIKFTVGNDGKEQIIVMEDVLEPVPDTSDTSNAGMWTMMLSLSFITVLGVLITRRKYAE